MASILKIVAVLLSLRVSFAVLLESGRARTAKEIFDGAEVAKTIGLEKVDSEQQQGQASAVSQLSAAKMPNGPLLMNMTKMRYDTLPTYLQPVVGMNYITESASEYQPAPTPTPTPQPTPTAAPTTIKPSTQAPTTTTTMVTTTIMPPGPEPAPVSGSTLTPKTKTTTPTPTAAPTGAPTTTKPPGPKPGPKPGSGSTQAPQTKTTTITATTSSWWWKSQWEAAQSTSEAQWGTEDVANAVDNSNAPATQSSAPSTGSMLFRLFVLAAAGALMNC